MVSNSGDLKWCWGERECRLNKDRRKTLDHRYQNLFLLSRSSALSFVRNVITLVRSSRFDWLVSNALAWLSEVKSFLANSTHDGVV